MTSLTLYFVSQFIGYNLFIKCYEFLIVQILVFDSYVVKSFTTWQYYHTGIRKKEKKSDILLHRVKA